MRFAQKWTKCTVHATRDVTSAIREIVLRPEGAGVEHHAIGSHVNVGVLIDGRPETRCYSLVGDFNPAGYRIAVRLAPDSRGGSRYMWTLKPGARIGVSSPASLLEIDWSRKSYCLIAGGIGITPMLGIAGALMRRSADIEFHYAVKSARRRRVSRRIVRPARRSSDRPCPATRASGSIWTTPSPVCRRMRRRSCAARCACLKRRGVAGRRRGARRPDLRYETFGSSGLLPTASFRVRIDHSGRESWSPRTKSMLDALNEAGFEVMSDCQRGECGVCAIDIVSVDGQIDHRDVFFSDHQKQANAKICPAFRGAVGAITVNTLYRSGAG